MRTASRGALATCGHVSQLSTLWHRDRGLGIHPHIFGPQVYAFAKTITHQPRLYNNRLPQARAAVDRYFTLPTTPTRTGVTLTPASLHNGTHLARSNVPPIQQTSIIRAKQAVGRLLGTYNFPNTPGFASQVGFGTAPSFHSSKIPIQKFPENAPISLRAFAEADWELRTKGKRPAKMTERKETPEVKKTKEMVKPIENKAQSISKTQVESDHTPPLLLQKLPPILHPSRPHKGLAWISRSEWSRKQRGRSEQTRKLGRSGSSGRTRSLCGFSLKPCLRSKPRGGVMKCQFLKTR